MKHLIVHPVQQTIDYLDQIFRDCPFNWDLSLLYLEIGSTIDDKVTAKPSSVYFVIPSGFDIWYDTATGMSHLLLPVLPSPKLARRHFEVGDAWDRTQFRPVISFGPAPSRRRHHAVWINSIATSFVDTSPIFGFTGEEIVEDKAITPEYADYHRDALYRGLIPNQVLLEEDEGLE